MAKNGLDVNEVTLLAAAFIRWGLGLFILGLIMGYPPVVHYLQNALEVRTGSPLENLTLWLGCPYALQIGALGMIAIGAIYGLFPADELEAETRDYMALWLCIGGLIAIALVGCGGYFALNTVSRFAFGAQPARETVWLYALSFSAAAYMIGVALAYVSILELTSIKAKR